MSNVIAFGALFAWPLVAVFLFKSLKPTQALPWAILGAYLLLPERIGVDLPMIPAIDKHSMAALTALLLCVLVLRRPIKLLPENKLGMLLVMLFVASPFVTVLGNSDGVTTLGQWRQPLSIYDAFNLLMRQAILIIPLMLGRQLLATEEAHRDILKVLLIAGLIYSVPMLVEIRLSPQLHTWVYGFFPHQFSQQIRGDGFRPVVFLGHGLLVALFAMTALLAAITFWRTRERITPLPPILPVAYLGILLVLCKTLGALFYGIVGSILLSFIGPKWRLRAMVAIALLALTYPILRGADIVPTDTVVQFVKNNVSSDRAESLSFRFYHEDLLLARANQRAAFGWGGFGRNQVYSELTKKEAVADGRWIQIISFFGWTGYIAWMGLLCLPVLLMARYARKYRVQIPIYTLALSLILSLNVVDLLINSSLRPWTWLIAGAILGYAEGLAKTARRPVGQPVGAVPPQPQAARMQQSPVRKPQ